MNKGGDAASASVSAPMESEGAPPPPPPGPPPPPPVFDDNNNNQKQADMSAVFSELNKGESVTSGKKSLSKYRISKFHPQVSEKSQTT